MTEHYYDLEFKLDAAHTPCECAKLMASMAFEGELLLTLKEMENEPIEEERDTQW